VIKIEEIWKNVSDIEGFEDFIDYQVSNMGNVKSTKRNKENGQILKGRPRKGRANKPYLRIIMYDKNGKNKQMSIHRLVLLAFKYVDNHEELTRDHIDEDTLNNKLKNLQWLTWDDNGRKSSKYRRKFSNEVNKEIKQKYNSGNYTYEELSIEYNSSIDTIWRIVNIMQV
jgi:hypothetical protein